MRLPSFLLLVFSLLLFPVNSYAGGKAGEKAVVTFHVQADEFENPKMIFPVELGGQQVVFRRMPEFSSKDVAAFNPFPSDDGISYGLVLQLKASAKNRLSAISAANQGRWMVSMTNGRMVDAVQIDRQVDDGLLVIWQGVTQEEIALYDKLLPRMGAAQ